MTDIEGTRKLGELARGEAGIIVHVDGPDKDLVRRLMEMGFLEGAEVVLVHEAPVSRDPIAVRVRGAIIALRRNEANHISVVES